jgi:LEA14-like dessication related protein
MEGILMCLKVRFLFVVVMLFLAGCGEVGSLFERPEAKITRVGVGGVTTRATQLVFDVDVSNPYQAALPLGNVDYALSTEGAEFLAGRADLQGSIPAGETKTLQLPVDVPYVELYQAVRSAMGKSEIPYLAELGLSVDAPVLGTLRLPARTQGTLALPTRESFLDILRREIEQRASP